MHSLIFISFCLYSCVVFIFVSLNFCLFFMQSHALSLIDAAISEYNDYYNTTSGTSAIDKNKSGQSENGSTSNVSGSTSSSGLSSSSSIDDSSIGTINCETIESGTNTSELSSSGSPCSSTISSIMSRSGSSGIGSIGSSYLVTNTETNEGRGKTEKAIILFHLRKFVLLNYTHFDFEFHYILMKMLRDND